MDYCILETDGRYYLYQYDFDFRRHPVVSFSRIGVPDGARIIGDLSDISKFDLITLISSLGFIEMSKLNTDFNTLNFRISNVDDISATESFLQLILKFQLIRTNHVYMDVFMRDGCDFVDITLQPRRKHVIGTRDVTPNIYAWINYILAECFTLCDADVLDMTHGRCSNNASTLRGIVVKN